MLSSWHAENYYESSHSPHLIKYINCCEKDKSIKDCDMHYLKTTDPVSTSQAIALRCTDGEVILHNTTNNNNECTKSAKPSLLAWALPRTETVPSMHAPAALFLAIFIEMKLT